ncbi:hypothetical protein GGQ15_002825 [Salinibacter ruber]|nr:transposase [Salinibacter ruber]MCS4142427.1 hypothetical protein [Salinibacter ruber]
MALSEESFLPDEEDCAETWRALRWPDGPECVECGSSDVAVQDWDYLSSLRRYQCRECGRWFNDIAKDLPHTYKTVHGMARTVREAIYQRRGEWREVLTGEVEADDVHLTLGQQGRTLGSEEATVRTPTRAPTVRLRLVPPGRQKQSPPLIQSNTISESPENEDSRNEDGEAGPETSPLRCCG